MNNDSFNPKGLGLKKALVWLAFLLFSVILIGLFWLYTTPSQSVGLALAYAAGLSMIILPCTLPLVFIIVPLCMGKNYKKGLIMAVLFGAGLSITIALYGVIIASLGQFLGIDQATRVMWGIAGLAALIFGISELNLIKWKMPGLAARTPKFIETRGDYFKAFFLGLFLGNAGVGCPNPAFYVLLTYIASVGSIAYGGWLGLIHGIGRATPLIFIAILAILGVNATQSLVKKRIQVEKITGWALVGIGAFILMLGIFGHAFWERSPLHLAWNKFVASLGIVPEITMGGHEFIVLPWLLMLVLIVIPIIWKVALNRVQEKYFKAVTNLSVAAILIVLIIGLVSQSISPVTELHGESKEFDVTAFQWGFEPQMIRVNIGDLVTLHVTSLDVGHGIASAEFGFDEILRPGETVDIQFIADKPGVFKFYCSLACGMGHDDQKGFLIVEDPQNPLIADESIQVNSVSIPPIVDGVVDGAWERAYESVFTTQFMGPKKPIRIKALHDQSNVYFLIRWNDDDQNDDGTTPTDRVAVQFDISGGSEISMGAAGVPHVKEEQRTIGRGIVDIWHWKAYDSHSEQRNVIDDEFAGPFPELAKHYYRDDDINYGGDNNLRAQGRYDRSANEWIVEIKRSFITPDVNIGTFGNLDKQLDIGQEYPIAFAIWDGGEGQDAGEHLTTDWGLIKFNR